MDREPKTILLKAFLAFISFSPFQLVYYIYSIWYNCVICNISYKIVIFKWEILFLYVTNIIPTSKDLTTVKNALLENKCVVLCLKTKTGIHFVLADELTANSGDDYLDRIKVADPADGTRKTLRQAIQRQMNPASASHVISGYCIY